MRELARHLGAVGRFVACLRVETGDTAPVIVVADADEAARLDPTGRRITVAEILGPPRYDALPDRVRDALSRERGRVTGLQPADPEAVAAAAWIEVVEELPWRRAEERPGAPAALRRAFDREHVGRGREKDQAIDYLVARQAAAERHAAGVPADDAVVLCLSGPAGIGRTAFARALAASIGRRFRPRLPGRRRGRGGGPRGRPARPRRGAGTPRTRPAELRPAARPARRQPAGPPRRARPARRGGGRRAARRDRPRAQPCLPGPLRRPAAGPGGRAVRRDRGRPGAHPAAAAGTARAVAVGRIHGRREGTHLGRAPDPGSTPSARVVRR